MKRGLRIAWLLICSLWLMAMTSWAATSGGAETVEIEADNNTEIYAGVVVDYMGKLKFHVTDRDTGNPIPGASVEIKIKVGDEERYVLFGVTDENGCLEIDIAHAKGQTIKVDEIDGKLTFTGTLLYLENNQIEYRVYKAGWLPYPKEGTALLESKEIPQTVEVQLYKKSEGGGNGGGGENGGGNKVPSVPDTPAEGPGEGPGPEPPAVIIPKTGVEGYIPIWAAGAMLFLAGAGILVYLLHKEKKERSA